MIFSCSISHHFHSYYNPDLLPSVVSFHLPLRLCCRPVAKNAFGKRSSWELVITHQFGFVVLEEEFLGTGRYLCNDIAVARFPLYLLGMQCPQ